MATSNEKGSPSIEKRKINLFLKKRKLSTDLLLSFVEAKSLSLSLSLKIMYGARAITQSSKFGVDDFL